MLYNNATQIKRDILYRVSKVLLKRDYNLLDYIPVEAAPRGKENIRCCIHKDRAIIKYRVMAALGLSVEDEVDEVTRLSEYGSSLDDKASLGLTVIKDACSSCSIGGYFITDACVGCVARPCSKVCPKGAVTFINGRSIINNDVCVNCGKCQDVCPYSAVVKVKVPCEESCPVSALKKDDRGVAVIDENKCISCGNCVKQCPFGAIADRSQLPQVIDKLLASGKDINALIAPSIAGQFPGSLFQIESMLKDMGFTNVVHVGNSAGKVASMEAEEFIENGELLTSSCCPAYVLCGEKHAPDIANYMSETPSPMELAGRENPQGINVFIGPCLAKKVEGHRSNHIDYVLTFEELGALAMAMELDSLGYKDSANSSIDKLGYGFAKSGGVTKGVLTSLRDKGVWITPESIDGIDKSVVKKFKVFEKLNKNYEFLEVMACKGGCLNGPGAIVTTKTSGNALNGLINND